MGGLCALPWSLEALSLKAWGSYPVCTFGIWAVRRGACAVQAVLASPTPSRKMATNFLAHEKIWFDKFKYDDAERKFYEQMNGPVAGSSRQVRAALGAAG